MIKNLIFDLDDTIVHCSRYYVECRRQFGVVQGRRLGIDAAVAEGMLTAIDHQGITLPDAWSRHRFPRSFVAASLALDTLMGRPPNADAAEQAYTLAERVFSAPYLLKDDVLDALGILRDSEANLNLALYTKGDTEYQWRKINKHNLTRFFKGGAVQVVTHKDVDQMWRVCKALDFRPDQTIMIGDSKIDDIAPAQALGMQTVWFENDDRPTYDTRVIEPSWTVRDWSTASFLLQELVR